MHSVLATNTLVTLGEGGWLWLTCGAMAVYLQGLCAAWSDAWQTGWMILPFHDPLLWGVVLLLLCRRPVGGGSGCIAAVASAQAPAVVNATTAAFQQGLCWC